MLITMLLASLEKLCKYKILWPMKSFPLNKFLARDIICEIVWDMMSGHFQQAISPEYYCTGDIRNVLHIVIQKIIEDVLKRVDLVSSRNFLSGQDIKSFMTKYIDTEDNDNIIVIKNKIRTEFTLKFNLKGALLFLGFMTAITFAIYLYGIFMSEEGVVKNIMVIYLSVLSIGISIFVTALLLSWYKNKKWNAPTKIYIRQNHLVSNNTLIYLQQIQELCLNMDKIYLLYLNGADTCKMPLACMQDSTEAVILYNVFSYFLPKSVIRQEKYLVEV